MKVDFKNPTNQRSIEGVRSQITRAEDLQKFDAFIEETPSFDFNDAEQVAKAKACCGGDRCCTIVISPTLDMKHF